MVQIIYIGTYAINFIKPSKGTDVLKFLCRDLQLH